MLELRPICENCGCNLPPESTQAMICSFECTFCARCAESLRHVCPNCAGGLMARPVRPARNWKNGFFLGNYPASAARKHRPADLEAHAELLRRLDGLPPERR